MSKFNFIQIERGYNNYGTPDRYRAIWIKGEHEHAVFNVAETRELKDLIKHVRKDWPAVEEYYVRVYHEEAPTETVPVKFAKTASALTKRIEAVINC
ncbi:hypothetical protein MERCI_23 [Klebsiella phage vB_KaeM_Merci]|nr:hypothetical protein MERCI_23 [Klebsiella phage vB_KaeM_Merci]